MPNYNSTARVPFKEGGSVKDKVKKVFDKSGLNLKKGFEGYKRLGSKIAKKFRDKKYKGKVHSTAEGRSAATKRTIKRGAKKALKIASYVNPLTAGYQLGKKFRGKKKIEHN